MDWMKCLKVRVASRKWTETEMGVNIHNYTHGKTTHKQPWPTGNNSAADGGGADESVPSALR